MGKQLQALGSRAITSGRRIDEVFESYAKKKII
jgi:hypothetical protein